MKTSVLSVFLSLLFSVLGARGAEPMEKVILDTDVGADIDDQAALLYLAKEPRCELLGVTTVGGASHVRAALASAILHDAGRADVKVYPGLSQPLVDRTDSEDGAAHLRRIRDWPHASFAPGNVAVDYLRRTIRENPGEITVVAVGPFSNLAALFAVDPGCADLVKRVVAMGGNFSGGKPEWNARCDAYATEILVGRRRLHRVRDLTFFGNDVTCRTRMEENAARAYFDSRPAFRILSALSGDWLATRHNATLHDPLAAVAVFHPEVCTYGYAEVETVTAGPEAGRTVVKGEIAPAADARRRVRVATDVDREKFYEIFGRVAGAPRAPYDVRLDGAALTVEEARHSAYPLNQVWPGYERPAAQSRLDAFVRFDLARPGELAVRLPAGCRPDEVSLRPYSCSNAVRVVDGVARIRLEKPVQYVLEFGENRPQLHVFADPPFTHVPASDEIYFGPGVHEAGLICPTNGQTVCIDAGATVYGALLLEGVTNVTVTGRGILDSSRIRRVSTDGRYLRKLSAEEKAKLVDVTAFMCRASENVRVEGVVFRDSPFWVLIFRDDCRHVIVDNVKVVGQWRYNSDGIDICGCKDVAVRNSFIRSFDDSFVVRDAFRGGEEGAARNIVCEDCLLWCDWGCNVKAQLSFADGATIEQVKVRRCVFANVQAMGVIVAARPGGRNGVVRDVAVEDVELDLPAVRLRQRMQHRENPDEAFVYEPQTNLTLFVVNNYDLRNRPLDRISLLYDRLAFRRFTVYGGPYEAAVAKVQLTAGKEEVRDFVAEDLPPRFFLSKKATFTTSAR